METYRDRLVETRKQAEELKDQELLAQVDEAIARYDNERRAAANEKIAEAQKVLDEVDADQGKVVADPSDA